jgi:hypothetical protein
MSISSAVVGRPGWTALSESVSFTFSTQLLGVLEQFDSASTGLSIMNFFCGYKLLLPQYDNGIERQVQNTTPIQLTFPRF